ncbi:hypothetical protein CK203_080990 [Vitis vinifera]|uniref:Uncharacterized protein n=1 Tax=Vitis vinifera TaxID=29760 RepID=A0A438EMQ7_VITVI|nr:hypothetical protein CK203_080990 [Vitis vinifera]
MNLLVGFVRCGRQKPVPVAQKIEKKASVMGLKVLNNLQSFPRGMECIDPLGLG